MKNKIQICVLSSFQTNTTGSVRSVTFVFANTYIKLKILISNKINFDIVNFKSRLLISNYLLIKYTLLLLETVCE